MKDVQARRRLNEICHFLVEPVFFRGPLTADFVLAQYNRLGEHTSWLIDRVEELERENQQLRGMG